MRFWGSILVKDLKLRLWPCRQADPPHLIFLPPTTDSRRLDPKSHSFLCIPCILRWRITLLILHIINRVLLDLDYLCIDFSLFWKLWDFVGSVLKSWLQAVLKHSLLLGTFLPRLTLFCELQVRLTFSLIRINFLLKTQCLVDFFCKKILQAFPIAPLSSVALKTADWGLSCIRIGLSLNPCPWIPFANFSSSSENQMSRVQLVCWDCNAFLEFLQINGLINSQVLAGKVA